MEWVREARAHARSVPFFTHALEPPLVSPKDCRAGLSNRLAGVTPVGPSSSPMFQSAAPSPPPASQQQGCPRHRLLFARTSPECHPAVPPPSSTSQHRSPPRPLRRQAEVVFHRHHLAVPSRSWLSSSLSPSLCQAVLGRCPCRRQQPFLVTPSPVIGPVTSSVPLPSSRLRPQLYVVKPCAGLVLPSSFGHYRSAQVVPGISSHSHGLCVHVWWLCSVAHVVATWCLCMQPTWCLVGLLVG